MAGNENGLIKVILEPRYNEILGAHLFCIHATDMIAEAVAAMNLEASAEETTRQFIHINSSSFMVFSMFDKQYS